MYACTYYVILKVDELKIPTWLHAFRCNKELINPIVRYRVILKWKLVLFSNDH